MNLFRVTIGILSQPFSKDSESKYKTFISKAFVDDLEKAGAQCVPLVMDDE